MTQDDVISKPFRIPDLLPKVKELVTMYNAPPTTEATPLA